MALEKLQSLKTKIYKLKIILYKLKIIYYVIANGRSRLAEAADRGLRSRRQNLNLAWRRCQGGTCTTPGAGAGAELVSRWAPVPGRNFISLGAGASAELIPRWALVPGRNLYLAGRQCRDET